MNLTLQTVKLKFLNQLLASFLLVSPAFCADDTSPHLGSSATVDEPSRSVTPVVTEGRVEPVDSVEAPSVVEEDQAKTAETGTARSPNYAVTIEMDSADAIILDVLQKIRKHLATGKLKKLKVELSPPVTEYLINLIQNKESFLLELQEKYQFELELIVPPGSTQVEFRYRVAKKTTEDEFSRPELPLEEEEEFSRPELPLEEGVTDLMDSADALEAEEKGREATMEADPRDAFTFSGLREPALEEGATEPSDSEELPPVEREGQDEMMEVTPKDESLEESKNGGFFNDILNNMSFVQKAFWSQFDDDFPNDDVVDDSKSAFLGRLKVESSAVLNDRWSFNASLLLQGSTYEDDLRGVFARPGTNERKGRILELKEAYLTFEEDEYDISLGKSLNAVGLSELFSPANRFGLVDAIHPMYLEELGVWKATFNYYVEDDSISYSLMPFHERSPRPDGRSRWLGSSGDSTFFELDPELGIDPEGNPQLEDEFRSSTDLESWGHLLQYNAVREGFDYFGLVHYGPTLYSVVKKEGGIDKKYNPLAVTLAAGLAKTVEEWKLYAEAAYQNTLKSEDEDFVKYVLGVSYRETEFAEKVGLEEISPIIEYAGEIVTNPQLADNFTVNSKKSRPGRNTLFLRVDFRRNDKWTGVFAVAHNIPTRDNFLTGLIQYSYSDNLKFNLERRMFSGRDDTQFGRWEANDYIGLNTEYKF